MVSVLFKPHQYAHHLLLLFNEIQIIVTHNGWHEGLGKLATALETTVKTTFRRPTQKRKSRPFFPVPLHALVGKAVLFLDTINFNYFLYLDNSQLATNGLNHLFNSLKFR